MVYYVPMKTNKKIHKKKLSLLERTAYHEAGHALLAFRFHIPIKEISIIEKGDSLGHVSSTHLPQSLILGTYSNNIIEKYIMWCFSGLAAESIVTGKKNYVGASLDSESATELIIRNVGSSEQATQYSEEMWKKTISWMKLPTNLNYLHLIAAILLQKKKLTKKDLKNIFKKSCISTKT
jgi:hypothetical protein